MILMSEFVEKKFIGFKKNNNNVKVNVLLFIKILYHYNNLLIYL